MNIYLCHKCGGSFDIEPGFYGCSCISRRLDLAEQFDSTFLALRHQVKRRQEWRKLYEAQGRSYDEVDRLMKLYTPAGSDE